MLLLATGLFLTLTASQEYSAAKGKGKIDALPVLGLGTFGIGGWSVGNSASRNPEIIAATRDTVKVGLSKGFRHIDTAMIYGNEKGVGLGIAAALKDGKLKREDIWITTKLWSNRYEVLANWHKLADKWKSHRDPETGLRGSLDRLGVSYIDMYLMHFPFGINGPNKSWDYIETWKKMQNLVRPGGPVRFIGVSNFSPEQMEELIKLPGIKPKAHQFEMHPYLQQSKFVKWHRDNQIAMTAYAPLGNTSPSYKNNYNKSIPLFSENNALTEIKNVRNCTSEYQVALAWNIQRGVSVIPKASRPEHQDENLNVESCKLEEGDMRKIEKFTTEKKWIARMNNPCKQYSMPCFKGLEEANGGAWRNGV